MQKLAPLALEALADGTRRAIVADLSTAESTVGDLAARLPVTRPAVSQHLRVLHRAGLVEDRVEGTRHYYRLSPRGLESLRTYVEELWGSALDRYAAAARVPRPAGGDMSTMSIAPILKTIVVPLNPDEAFDLFFNDMTRWWPLHSHSVYEAGAAKVEVDGRQGGHILENAADGRSADWGELLVWEPPDRAVFTWHPGYADENATEVEVRFTAEGALTRVDLEHRGWTALGERAERTRDGYETGWNYVFAVRFGSVALERKDY